MTWTPPDHGFHPPPAPPARLSWKIGNSLWLLAPLLSCGCASVAGFLYVGLRAGRPAWWIAGICYSVVANVSLFWSDSLPKESNAATVGALIWVLAWVVSVAHAVAINSAWLRWLAGRQAPVRHVPFTQPERGPLPPRLHGIVPGPHQYYAGQQPSPAPDHAPPPYSAPAYYTPPPYPGTATTPYAPPPLLPETAPQPLLPDTAPVSFHPDAAPASVVPPEADLLDVNTAVEEQFAALPTVGPERAARAVAARRERNGFTGVADFAAAAGLAPHQFAAIRDRLTCSPAPVTPTTSGEDLPYGRIVDV